MSSSARAIASQFCDLMPVIERTVSSELRRGSQYVTPSHLQLLTALVQGPSSLSGLSEVMAVSLPTMSNAVTTFVERGWVKRTQSADDRRYIKVELTDKGSKALVDIRRRVELLFSAQFEHLPPAKREELKTAFKILHETFQPKHGEANNGSTIKKRSSQKRPGLR
jgi:DNA-binding MarR family transcriptional regulator